MDVPASIAVLGSDGAIAADLACSGCGYNLRGLTLDRRCPECGTTIARSAFGTDLRYSDPSWVDKLQRGANLLRWYIALRIMMGVMGGAVGAILGALGAATLMRLQAILIPVGLVVQCLGVAGAYLITTREPRVTLTEDPVTLRKVVRVCMLATFVGNTLNSTVALSAGFPAGSARSNLVFAVVLVSAALIVVGIVGFMGEFVFFRRFALRIPDEKLAGATRTVMWGFVVSYALIILGAGIAALGGGFKAATGGGSGAPSGGELAGLIGGGFVACAALVSLVVFVCWAYRLLLRYNRAFAEAAAQARAFAAQYPENAAPAPA